MLATIEDRIRTIVNEHHEQLAQLVRDTVDRELAALVELELAGRNGHAVAPAGTTRHCRRCDREKPLDQFEKGRAVCRDCRRQQVRERAVRAQPDGVP